jgi:hypothetical protein
MGSSGSQGAVGPYIEVGAFYWTASAPDIVKEALGNKRAQNSPRPNLFRLNGFDADRRLLSLCPSVFRLIRASMG